MHVITFTQNLAAQRSVGLRQFVCTPNSKTSLKAPN